MTGPAWRGRHLEARVDDGWEYVVRPGAIGVVAVIALRDDGALVLVEQRRPPVRAPVVEIPAGLAGDLDAGEDLLVAAQRELLEETGFTASSWVRLNDGPSSAGLTDERPVIFVARGLTREHAGGGDASEAIEVHVVPPAAILPFLRDARARGALIDPKVLVALWVAGIPWDGVGFAG